jgi:hypothetical protein
MFTLEPTLLASFSLEPPCNKIKSLLCGILPTENVVNFHGMASCLLYAKIKELHIFLKNFSESEVMCKVQCSKHREMYVYQGGKI